MQQIAEQKGKLQKQTIYLHLIDGEQYVNPVIDFIGNISFNFNRHISLILINFSTHIHLFIYSGTHAH